MQKNKFYILGFLLFLSLEMNAQVQFLKSFDNLTNNQINQVRTTDDDGFIVMTSQYFSGPPLVTNLVLMKYDACGEMEWGKRYHNNLQTFSDIIVTNTGDYVITGNYSTSINDRQIFMLKVNQTGDVLWFKTFNAAKNEFVYSLGESPNGDYFVYGNTESFSTSLSHNFVLKTNANGDKIWSKRYFNIPIWGWASATSDGGLLCRTGNLFYKINGNGTVIWANEFSNASYASYPLEVADGYVFVKYPSSATNTQSTHVFKLDFNGNIVWKSYATNLNTVRRIYEHPSGDLVFMGMTRNNIGQSSIGFARINSNGQYLKKTWVDNSVNNSSTGHDFVIKRDGSMLYTGIREVDGSPVQLLIVGTTDSSQLSSCGYESALEMMPEIDMQKTFTEMILPQDIHFDELSPELMTNTINISEQTTCQDLINPLVNQTTDTTFCAGDNIVLDATNSNNVSYLWDNGYSNPRRPISEIGTYTATLSLCGTTATHTFHVSYADCPCRVAFPNSFSPNEDGKNDEFGAIYDCSITKYKLQIFNRWGQEVFQTNDPTATWDGTYKKKKMQQGVFVFVVEYEAYFDNEIIKKQDKGNLTLLY